MFAASFESE